MLVSIVIPCRDEKTKTEGLEQDIVTQKKAFEIEVIKITGIAPPAKARNTGAERTKGDIIIFIDADMRLGNDRVIDNVVRPLLREANIGAVNCSILIPQNASLFQKCYAEQIPHSQVPIVDELRDIGLATTQCLAMRKSLFLECGGFREEIIRGEDSELAVRIKNMGYRIVLAPQTWSYHPLPVHFIELIKTQFRNGVGVSFVDIFHPELNIDVAPDGIMSFTRQKSINERICRFGRDFLGAVFGLKFLLLSAKCFYLAGYGAGFIKYGIFRCRN